MGKKENHVDHDRRRKDPARLSPTAWGVIVAVIGTVIVAGVIASQILPEYDLVMTSQFALLINLAGGVVLITLCGISVCLLRSVDCTNEGMRVLSRDLNDVKQTVAEHLQAKPPNAVPDVVTDVISELTERVVSEIATVATAQANTSHGAGTVVVQEAVSHDAEIATAGGTALGDTQEIVLDQSQASILQHATLEQMQADTVEINAAQVRALTREADPLDEDDREMLDALEQGPYGLGADEIDHLQEMIRQIDRAVKQRQQTAEQQAPEQIEVSQVPNEDQLIAEATEEAPGVAGKVVYIQRRRLEETPEEKRARLEAEIQEHGLNATCDELIMILQMANCHSYSALPQSYKDILLNRPSQNPGNMQDNVAEYRGA